MIRLLLWLLSFGLIKPRSDVPDEAAKALTRRVMAATLRLQGARETIVARWGAHGTFAIQRMETLLRAAAAATQRPSRNNKPMLALLDRVEGAIEQLVDDEHLGIALVLLFSSLEQEARDVSGTVELAVDEGVLRPLLVHWAPWLLADCLLARTDARAAGALLGTGLAWSAQRPGLPPAPIRALALSMALGYRDPPPLPSDGLITVLTTTGSAPIPARPTLIATRQVVAALLDWRFSALAELPAADPAAPEEPAFADGDATFVEGGASVGWTHHAAPVPAAGVARVNRRDGRLRRAMVLSETLRL